MKKVKIILVLMISLLALSTLLIACRKDDKKQNTSDQGTKSDEAVRLDDKKTFTIGCMPLNEPAVQIIKELLKSKGYDAQINVFDGNHLPAMALKEGNIDSLILNHLPWVDTFNEEQKTELTMVEPYTYHSVLAIYSSKYKNIDEITQNAQIAIPGDPTNMDRCMRILSDVGIITLGEKTGAFYSLLDIKHNPKNIKFVETETASTVRSMNDVDAIITFSSSMKMAGFDPESYLYKDKDSSKFPVGFVVKKDNVDAEWLKAAVGITQSDEFKKKFNEIYGGAYKLYNDLEDK